ncbi:hypothetical protein [Allobranchiibius sp. GilTou73]|uniref:hypothetical protein n=1 Tax=Allobranchiibius sp. GilTou73 TaxID=2904523 RepID=UPI001F3307BE|nr:hypothetical protein [Allobranchiibius sp. GilTou73]UIJ35994.1 hypothetical protein LVQ62_06360 [Allobranchiibius sp. GilTou73]
MVSAVLVVCAAVALLLVALDHRYGPLQGGSFSGPVANDLAFINEDSSYRLTSAPGTTGQVIGSLYNPGSHAVTIRSASAGDMAPAIGVQWSVFHTVPDGSAFGVDTPWHSFPATIPAQGTIRLLLTLHRPSTCPPNASFRTDSTFDGSLLLRWKSLLRTHTTFADNVTLPIRIR